MEISNYTEVQKEFILEFCKGAFEEWEWIPEKKNIYGNVTGELYRFKKKFRFLDKEFELAVEVTVYYKNPIDGKKILNVYVYSAYYPTFPWRMWDDQCVRMLQHCTGWSENYCWKVRKEFTLLMEEECRNLEERMRHIVQKAATV